MSSYHCAIPFILFVIPLTNAGLQSKTLIKKTVRSEYGKYLTGHVFKTTSGAVDPQHCLSDCWRENDRCQSFNYFVDSDVCELNEKSDETAPGNFIDKSRVVYLRNPAFGRDLGRKIQMERHPKPYPAFSPDPCASNPCEHAKYCVKDAKLGFLCKNCHSGYYGPRCEEFVDPCKTRHCEWGGTCQSTMTTWKCFCLFPFTGSTCSLVNPGYVFELDGTGSYPYMTLKDQNFGRFTVFFWFKTAERNTSYFMSLKPGKESDAGRLSIWQVNNTFFVQLHKDMIHNFTFPLSYPVHDNYWHLVTIVLTSSAYVRFYLDGLMRVAEQRTIGEPGRNDLYVFQHNSVLRIGYYEDSNGQEHFYRGSIGSVDMRESNRDYFGIRNDLVRSCLPNVRSALWTVSVWKRLHSLSRPVNCSRTPILGLTVHSFKHDSRSRWMEQAVSPARDLTGFTMIFQFHMGVFSNGEPMQIACYGNPPSNACTLSLAIRSNLTLEVIIETTSFSVDLIPFQDNRVHIMVVTWTNKGGIFELMIDGVLQSRVTNVESNGKITGQSRFLLGGFDGESRNFVGYINSFNVWDKVISDDVLYLMTREPGDDMGNLVCWRDFKKPDSIPSQVYSIQESGGDSRVASVGYYKNSMWFPKSLSYADTKVGSLSIQGRITVSMWFNLFQLPATLFTFSKKNASGVYSAETWIEVRGDGEVAMQIKESDIRLGFISVDSIDQDTWHSLAFTHDSNGHVHCNLNGVHQHVSSSFKSGYYFDMRARNALWTIGGIVGRSLVGRVAQANIWFRILPPPALMALSRGVNGLDVPSGVDWGNFIVSRKGTYMNSTMTLYLPDFAAQSKRDEYCNSHASVPQLPCNSQYRARLGSLPNNGGRKFACFCEDQLSFDMNFNNGTGDYSLHDALVNFY